MKRDMTTGKEWKQILFFSLPIMLGNLLQQLYNTVDSIIVGQFVSEDAFAGVSTCAPISFFYLGIAVGLSIGAGVVISQFFGAGMHEELPVCIDTALILLGLCGLLLTIVSLIITPFLLGTILSVPENVLPFAVTYFRVYSLGFFFQFIYNSIAATLRGFGDSKAILIFLVIATVLNTILDIVFIVVFRWSVAGAAAATVVAQMACAAVSFIYMRKRFPFVKSGRHWNRKISMTMTKLGLPIAIQQGLVAVGQGSMQRLLNGFEPTVPGVIAAYGSAFRVDSFYYCLAQGFQSGLSSFTGQNIGAAKIDRVKRGLLATQLMSLATAITLGTLLYIFAGQVVALFGLTGDAWLIGIEIIRFLSLFFWAFSCYTTFAGLLQGAGDTLILSATTLTSLAIRIVTGYSAVYFGLLGYSASWVTFPIGWIISIIILGSRYFTGVWKKKAVAGKLSHKSGESS